MAKKANILVIASWYPKDKTDFSGIFIKEQVEILSKKFRLVVVNPIVDYKSFNPFGKPKINRSLENGVEVIRIEKKRSFPIYNQWNFLRIVQKVIHKEIINEKIDLIHAHVSYPGGVIAMMLAKKLRIPYMITEHYGGFVGLFRSKIHKFLIIRALNNAYLITTVSNYSAKIIKNFTSTPIEIIPNVIDISKFDLKQTKEKHKRVVAGFLGGLDTQVKGLDILLKALNHLKNENLKVIIGGSGKLLPYYMELAKKLNVEDKCEFLGLIPAEKRYEFFKDLDFFILPSRHESFGLVLLEAMASGIPVLATRCGGPEEIVEENTGFLVEKENPESLAKGIQKMIKNLSKFNPIEIRNRVNQKFGKEVFLQKMVEVYNSVLDRNEEKE